MYIDQFVCLFFYTRGRPHRLLHILHFSTPSPHRLLHRAFSWERRARGGGEAGGEGEGPGGKGGTGGDTGKKKSGRDRLVLYLVALPESDSPREGLGLIGPGSKKGSDSYFAPKKNFWRVAPAPPNPAESGSQELFSAHKSLQEDPKRFLDASKTIQEADKMSRDCSRRPINGPRRILDEPKLDPEASKIRISLFWCGFAEAKSNKNRSRNVSSFKRAYKPKNTIFLV